METVLTDNTNLKHLITLIINTNRPVGKWKFIGSVTWTHPIEPNIRGQVVALFNTNNNVPYAVVHPDCESDSNNYPFYEHLAIKDLVALPTDGKVRELADSFEYFEQNGFEVLSGDPVKLINSITALRTLYPRGKEPVVHQSQATYSKTIKGRRLRKVDSDVH